MKMFLVPVDLSSVTDKVILAFARAFEGRITLLHVIQPPVVAGSEYALPAPVVEETVVHNRNNAQARLAGRKTCGRPGSSPTSASWLACRSSSSWMRPSAPEPTT